MNDTIKDYLEKKCIELANDLFLEFMNKTDNFQTITSDSERNAVMDKAVEMSNYLKCKLKEDIIKNERLKDG